MPIIGEGAGLEVVAAPGWERGMWSGPSFLLVGSRIAGGRDARPRLGGRDAHVLIAAIVSYALA